MSEKQPVDALTRLLRAGDPATGDPGLNPTERALMRQEILAASSKGPRRAVGWLLPAATAMALLALALGLALRRPPAPLPHAAGEPPQLAHASTSTSTPNPTSTSTSTSNGQQIQFTTDSGILVVWVLQPRPTS